MQAQVLPSLESTLEDLRQSGEIMALGYRLYYKNRFELICIRQSSRNEIESGFISDDNVIQLRYIMFLNPAKPGSEKQ